MAKDLPYFRFTVQDWQNGKISLERYELQGLFISVCGYYWINDCNITMAMLQKKFSNAKALLGELVELGILKHEIKHDKIKIDFLLTQQQLLSEKRKRRQDAGSKGGNAKAMLWQNRSYKDKDKDKDILSSIEDIGTNVPKPQKKERVKFLPPEISDIKNLFLEKNSTEAEAERFFAYYQSNGWKVGKNPMKDWEAAARGWISRQDQYTQNKPAEPLSPAEATIEHYKNHPIIP